MLLLNIRVEELGEIKTEILLHIETRVQSNIVVSSMEPFDRTSMLSNKHAVGQT